MERIVAYCGLVCNECPAYVATQANDQQALEQVVAQWRKEFNAPDMTVESIVCDGCLGTEVRHCGYCAECNIRACGMEHGVANCAYCDDYPCDKLAGFLQGAPNAKIVLDEIHRSV